MKKFIAITIFLSCIAAFAWHFFKPSPIQSAPADLLFTDTLFMVELIDLEKKLDRFKSSKLGQNLKKIDVNDILLQIGALPHFIESYKTAESTILSFLDSMLFKSLFGKQVMLALLPLQFDPSQPISETDRLKGVLAGFVLIARPKHGVELTDFIGDLFSKQLELQTYSFYEHQIKHFGIHYGQTIYYATKDGLLIAALNHRTLEKCLHPSPENDVRLSQNRQYRYLYDRLAASSYHHFIYADAKQLIQTALNFVTALPGGTREKLPVIDVLDNLKGFNKMASALYEENESLVRNKLIATIDREELSPLMKRLVDFSPQENKTLKMTPRNLLLYNWSGLFDLKTQLDLYASSKIYAKPVIEKIKDWVENSAGLDFDQAIDTFGNQVGFVLADILTGGIFPFPNAAFYIEVKNKDIPTKLISSLIDRSGLTLQREEFEGVPIYFIVTPLGGAIQPAYAFFKDFVIISTNKELIQRSITTYENGDGVVDDNDFKSINFRLTDKNNRISFIKFHALLGKAKEILGWANQILAFKNRNAAKQMNIVTSGAVNPILNGLSMYQNIGSRTVIKENEIETDIYCQIEK
ncbi:hypothetical protein ACFLZM_06305 [Thermodesulfobacteriota bacterium]